MTLEQIDGAIATVHIALSIARRDGLPFRVSSQRALQTRLHRDRS